MFVIYQKMGGRYIHRFLHAADDGFGNLITVETGGYRSIVNPFGCAFHFLHSDQQV